LLPRNGLDLKVPQTAVT